MSSLTIVCPNAKRCIVKVTPKTLLREVLEEACLKQGFDPNEYIVYNQKKIIDLSLPFRLSGLSNNASLELHPAPISKSVEAEIALQLPDGRRKLHKFSINTSLNDIINHFSKEFEEDLITINDAGVPSCVYMNKEYSAQQLDSTTLSSIGISSGRCLMRYQRLKLSGEQLKQIEDKVQMEARKKEILSNQFEQKRLENEERKQLEMERMKKFEEDCKKSEENRLARTLEAMDVDMNITGQIMQNDAIFPQDRIQTPPSATHLPNSDWSFDRPFTDSNRLSSNTNVSTDNSRLAYLNRLLNQVDNSISMGGSTHITEILADGGPMSISQIATAASQMEHSLENKTSKEVFAEACDRCAVLFDKRQEEQAVSEPIEVDEPDDFFDVGISDVKRRQRELRQDVLHHNQRALLPKSFVDNKNRDAKLEAYQHSIVRYIIGNRVIQANFNTREPAIRIFQFLQSILSTNVKFALNFALNDPVEQSDSKNLVDVNIAPKATIYVKFKTAVDYDTIIIPSAVRMVNIDEANNIGSDWLSVNSIFQLYTGLMVADERPMIPKRSADSENNHQPPAKANAPKWLKFK